MDEFYYLKNSFRRRLRKFLLKMWEQQKDLEKEPEISRLQIEFPASENVYRRSFEWFILKSPQLSVFLFPFLWQRENTHTES
jgi:hypothetical protein